MIKNYYKVAVEAPLNTALTYGAPQGMEEHLVPGISVLVPLGKRNVKGVVTELTTEAGNYTIKDILSINPERPIIFSKFLKWLLWISDYYLYPVGQVLQLAFPPLKEKINRKKVNEPLFTNNFNSQMNHLVLTDEQSKVLKDMSSYEGFNVHLLHGVTGSGKTEVYLQLIKKTLDKGKQALVLVPEIVLTPQLIQRFTQRFPNQVANLHSELTPREKTNQWWSMFSKEKNILIGARSALFCPLKDIDIIILDEEHDTSFKQDEKLKYHARDVAIKLAHYLNCPIIVGSATPSLEAWRNVQNKKFHLHRMVRRVANRKLPDIQVIDLRKERRLRKKTISELPFWLSATLFEEIKNCLEDKKQVALFLNRRGVAQNTFCSSCGYVFECPNCSISLTLHSKSYMVCHYCDYSTQIKEICPKCSEPEIKALGLGTELLENDIKKLFPEHNIARADRDEIKHHKELKELIFKMEEGEIDILIGTQMIAKGLDFPNLTLVGIIMADVGFNMPDFRSSERSFQLLTQVSGRSGRHSEKPGKVILQTYNPEHLSIVQTVDHNYDLFAKIELNNRQSLDYPPYWKLAAIRVQGLKLDKTNETCEVMRQRASYLQSKYKVYEALRILGPAPAPIAKIRNRFRFHFLIKSPSPQLLNQFCKHILGEKKWISTGTKVLVDMDPLNML